MTPGSKKTPMFRLADVSKFWSVRCSFKICRKQGLNISAALFKDKKGLVGQGDMRCATLP